MKNFLTLFSFLFATGLAAQSVNLSCPEQVSRAIAFNPGRAPQFPGGDSALQKYVKKNLTLEKKEVKDMQGKKITVLFDVDSTGKVCNVKSGTAADPVTDLKVVNLFCAMPAWQPGGVSGDNGSTVSQPLNFRMRAEFHYASGDTAAFVHVKPLSKMLNYKPATASDPIFMFAEEMPAFDGDFQEYLGKHIRYPQNEKGNGKQGTVYVSFVIEIDGSVSNITAVKDVADAPGLTAEALNVLWAMPKWKPGKMNGRAVRVQMTVPIKFVLQ